MRARSLGLAVVSLLAFGLLPELAASAATVPFTDPAAHGEITLCDSTGHVMQGGSIYGKPFAWRAVGSQAAPSAYVVTGRTASLYAFQPIQSVDPIQWNGENLTAGSRYTSPVQPMAAASPIDPTLADYLGDYPTKWDGLVQLRMFVGAPRMATYTQTYDTAVLRVSGSTWSLVQGGTSGCTSGASVSAEVILPSVSALPTPPPTAESRPAGVSTSSAGTKSGSTAPGSSTSAQPGSRSGAAADDPDNTGTAVNQTGTSSSSSTVVIIAVIIAAVLAAGLGLLWWRRRVVE
jgi:LPXTG-motif cell wall-anchored protein